MRIFAAPLQGFTDAAWRHFHAEIYGGIDSYFTPFLRVEKGVMRPQDIKSISSPLNANQSLIPQIIFRDITEFDILVNQVISQGYKAIDLNLGCPFPPQVKHGRGSALILNRDLLEEVEERIAGLPDIEFSVKMRLGVDSPDQWQEALPSINRMRLTHVTVHPRIAKQQYTGDLYLDQFARFLSESQHPVIFNGDLTSVEGIDELVSEFPAISGIMIGRGLLMRPSLAIEYANGEEWDETKRMRKLMNFHELMFEYYRDNLCGDTQILSKIKPFWEYLEPEIGRKASKAIRKATSLSKYVSAVGQITF